MRVDFDARETLMRSDPRAYFITDHYTGYEMMLVRVDAVDRDAMAEMLEQSWRRMAPKGLVAELDASEG